jgi:putative transposase
MRGLMFKQRKQNRLKGFDYSSEGYYFITVCIHNKKEIFGHIKNDVMILSKAGKIAQNKWLEIPEHHKYAEPKEFVIMPNHMHGIIQIKEQVQAGLTMQVHAGMNPTETDIQSIKNSVQAGLNPTAAQYSKLAITIGSYKSGVSREIRRANYDPGFEWQKSFYDHIIRDESSHYNIVKYISENPLKWSLDIENSAVTGNSEDYYDNIYKGIEKAKNQ